MDYLIVAECIFYPQPVYNIADLCEKIQFFLLLCPIAFFALILCEIYDNIIAYIFLYN